MMHIIFFSHLFSIFSTYSSDMQTLHKSVANKERIKFKNQPDYRSCEGHNGKIDYEYLKSLKARMVLKQQQQEIHQRMQFQSLLS